MDPLLVDLYADDQNGDPDVTKLEAAGYPWIGVSLKISQGAYYASPIAWLEKYWKLARTPAGYGNTWFRQAYAYLDLTGRSTSKQQWDFFVAHVEAHGGFGHGDLPIGIDVEQASNPSAITAQKIIDYVSQFAALAAAYTGEKPICYGGSYLRDHGVKDHMGCQAPWVADYASTLPPSAYQSIGYPKTSDVFGWQYEGTEADSGPAGYPRTSPCGHTDISAIIWAGGGEAAMQRMRDHCLKKFS